jgi:predicted enzyme related to lactoylglutathione lyase
MTTVTGTEQQAPVRSVPGAPSWVCLSGHDLARLEEFYGRLLGWLFRDEPGLLAPYRLALLDGTVVAGVAQVARPLRLPVAWTVYFGTEDVDREAVRVRDFGGTVAVGPLDVGRPGRAALVADPQGAVFGLWQGRRGQLRALRGPGMPVRAELHAHDPFAAAVFYAQLFGWDGPDRPGYTIGYEPGAVSEDDAVVLSVDGHRAAVICGEAPIGAPPEPRAPSWQVHFAVTDVDAAAQRVPSLGGELEAGPAGTARGRTALVRDPEGALFALTAAEL